MQAPQQLPRGTHGLSREEVRDSQRRRMLEAAGRATAEKGYGATTVADVIRGAGVSRETFYEHFANKQECFLAAYDTGVEELQLRMVDALAGAGEKPLERLSAALRAYLVALASEPAFARAALIELYAAGPDALERRFALQQRFVDLVASILGARSEEDRFACEAFVAATSSMVTARVGSGAIADLPALHEPLMKHARRAFGDVPSARRTAR